MLRARTQALKSDVALRCPRDTERERESERAREAFFSYRVLYICVLFCLLMVSLDSSQSTLFFFFFSLLFTRSNLRLFELDG